jgi:hypothetical protein
VNQKADVPICEANSVGAKCLVQLVHLRAGRSRAKLATHCAKITDDRWMQVPMIGILGWLMCVAVVLVATLNACYMLLSPRAWFRLSHWSRAEGSLTAEKYSIGWGAVQVRLSGAVILAAICWVFYDLIFRG